MRAMACVFCILLIAGAVVCDSSNPFYVDPSSVKKDTYKWTMKLKNHNGGASANTANKEIKSADVTVEGVDKAVLHLKIVDAEEQRWEPPMLNPDSGKRYNKNAMDNMGFTYNNDPFGFSITDPTSRQLMVDMSATKGSSLQFLDKYLEIGMSFDSQRVYGLGERTTEEFELCSGRDECQYTLWGKDVASPLDDGGGGGKGAYGQQPFYMIYFPTTKLFMGVLMFNSNDQDAVIKKLTGSIRLTHKMIGGVFDLYFFYPGTADFVLRNYHELIGRPYIAPFWALGYHQCRYGWRTLDKVKEVVAKFEESDLPLDVVWADIDYMKDYADFTVDPTRYRGLKEFVQDLHKKKIKWVPIIDAGLKYNVDDKYYKLGVENNALIMSAYTKKVLIGAVWPGSAVFVSWFAPYAKTLWHTGLSDLYEQVQFDGIWLDMNEVANFCHGECPPKSEGTLQEDQIAEEIADIEQPTRRSLRKPKSEPDPHDPKEFDNIPYKPGGDPTDKTLSMSGYHYHSNDFEDRVLKEYNTHSIWGLLEAKATHEFFVEKLQTRPFVLTRANFPGSGLFTTKWLGDNHARWDYLRYSIVGIYNFQMFGMPLVGSDMCGFMGDTTEELCARWMQAGSFYPFTRNHNDIHSRDQEPYLWEKVATVTRNAVRQKYSILRYYYTKLYEVSLYGGAFVKPLFFEFPEDPGVHEKTKFMFMLGPSILIPPVLHEGLESTYPYLINENWFNLRDFTQVFAYSAARKQGEQITLPAKFDYANVLLKGGSIIPYQDALGAKVRRTETLNVLPMDMIVAPDHNGKADGSLITDEGNSVNPIQKKEYRYLKFDFSLESKQLDVTVVNDYDGKNAQFEEFSRVLVFGAEKWSSVRNACLYAKSEKKKTLSGSYDGTKKTLTFSGGDTNIFWREITKIVFDASC